MITTISLVTVSLNLKVFYWTISYIIYCVYYIPKRHFIIGGGAYFYPLSPPSPIPTLSFLAYSYTAVTPPAAWFVQGDVHAPTPASHPAPPSPSPAAPQSPLCLRLYSRPANRLISTIVPGFPICELAQHLLSSFWLCPGILIGTLLSLSSQNSGVQSSPPVFHPITVNTWLSCEWECLETEFPPLAVLVSSCKGASGNLLYL